MHASRAWSLARATSALAAYAANFNWRIPTSSTTAWRLWKACSQPNVSNYCGTSLRSGGRLVPQVGIIPSTPVFANRGKRVQDVRVLEGDHAVRHHRRQHQRLPSTED